MNILYIYVYIYTHKKKSNLLIYLAPLSVISPPREETLIKAKRIAMETGIPSSHGPRAGKERLG